MNNHLSTNNWFTEQCNECGSAFSLQIDSKLHEEQSPFQKIEIYATKHFGNLMVIDGLVMLSARDNFIYHEMMVHPVLFSHPAPRHVVIVGGGDCGTLQQVAKHQQVEKITQIEIDERVTRLSEKYFPELCTANQDSRVHFVFNDAIEWMAQKTQEPVDVIIVDSTDPIGPAEGLFQKDFYADCCHHLSDDGLFIQQSESPLIHWQTIIQPMSAAMRSGGFNEMEILFFPLPVYPSGWWSAMMAAKNKIQLVRDKDAKNPGFNTKYYNYEIHLGAFTKPEFLKAK